MVPDTSTVEENEEHEDDPFNNNNAPPSRRMSIQSAKVSDFDRSKNFNTYRSEEDPGEAEAEVGAPHDKRPLTDIVVDSPRPKGTFL